MYQPERAFVPRGTDNGIAAAQIAHLDAVAVGMPPDRPIYFSVDGDTRGFTGAQWAETEAFFSGVNSIIGLERTGVYGGKNTVEHLKARGFATWLWQTYAWSAGQWADVHLRQHLNNQPLCGGTVDHNRAMRPDYGQW